jgi:hypothetical protein
VENNKAQKKYPAKKDEVANQEEHARPENSSKEKKRPAENTKSKDSIRKQPTVSKSTLTSDLRLTVNKKGVLECPDDTDEQLMEVFGTKDSWTLVETFLTGLVPIIENTNEVERQCEIINCIIPLMKAIGPKNELETMLACQMIGVHHMSMQMMKRAMLPDQTVDGVNFNVNRATKLTRTFIAQMEALDKHRGKGQQKITVEHVTVNEGGQAVVGNVGQGGRDEQEK